ncbi:type II secretion system F family protein [methane-oxidizing endosymbiont of Gigantopelta aegis]|uniref:type II secretion system F family protein n=1 Tax=methane-oxidizing endosymbiont of Gigantopelta aegis TaxID=2794938 RepID=UPI0018DDAD4C|nr:type II secretion system F family protein [methane-oxidizing endosymbiont of Gigantopelta aegis]
MKRFSYLALNRQGQEVRGKLEAQDQEAAMSALRQQGLRVLEIKARRGSSGFLGQANFSDWLASQRSVSTSALIFFFRQLSFMLRSGLSLAHALSLAKDQVSSPRLNLTIRLMLKDIESGHALSQAMKKHPQVFSEMAINLIIAGETTGDLGVMMERLADHISKKAALRAQVINAMIYPAVVILAAIGVGIFMVVKIIPKFAKFLLGKGRALPPSTQMLIDISDYLRANGVVIAIGLAVLIAMVLILYQTRYGRLGIDSLLLRIPITGSLLVNAAMAQLSWTLSILLRSGIPVFDAVKVTANLLPNRVYFNQLHKASEQILQGRDLARSLSHPQIPPLVLHMIAVGENSGSLDDVLEELGVYYENLLEIAIKRLSAMIEPAMILVIGSMVGFVYYAFFQALFSLVGGR